MAQIHRFRDTVAIYVGSGATVYMTVEEARAMAGGLTAIADSIEREPFAASPPLTKTFVTYAEAHSVPKGARRPLESTPGNGIGDRQGLPYFESRGGFDQHSLCIVVARALGAVPDDPGLGSDPIDHADVTQVMVRGSLNAPTEVWASVDPLDDYPEPEFIRLA